MKTYIFSEFNFIEMFADQSDNINGTKKTVLSILKFFAAWISHHNMQEIWKYNNIYKNIITKMVKEIIRMDLFKYIL